MTESSRRRFDVLCVFLVAAAAFGVWAPRLTGPLDLRFDGSIYYVLGAGLADGRGYRLLHEPGEVRGVQYPPLLSASVAFHQRVIGSTSPARVGSVLRYTFLILFVSYIAGIYLLGRQFLSPLPSMLIALTCALHAYTVFLSDLLFAEIPFALATVLFFLAVRAPDDRWRRIAPVFAIAAFLFRTVGLALLLAWVGESLIARRYRVTVKRAAIAMIPVLAWQAYTASVKASAEYVKPAYPYQRAPYLFYNVGYTENVGYRDPRDPDLGRASARDMVARLAGNLVEMPSAWGEAMSAGTGWWEADFHHIERAFNIRGIRQRLALITVISLSALAAAGLALLARRGERMIPLYVLGSTALICTTPWPDQFARYLVPVAPFLATGAAVALQRVRERSRTGPPRSLHAAATAAAVLIVGIVLVEQYRVLRVTFSRDHFPVPQGTVVGAPPGYRLFYFDSSWQAQGFALAWLREHAGDGDIVGSFTPGWAYLQTGLKSVMPPFVSDPAVAQQLMDAVPIRYLLLDDVNAVAGAGRFAAAAIDAHPDLWTLTYSDSLASTRIYRRAD